MTRDTGIRGIFPGFRFKDEVQEDLRSQVEIRKRIEAMTRADPIQPINLGYGPVLNLKPTEILHKEGEYGHRVASHNKKFPRFKTTVLPKKEKQRPQYGVKPIDSFDSSTFPYNQKEAMATADAMDQAVVNTKTRINQIHKNPASKIIEKEQSIKDLQKITDIAYDYSNNKWKHKPQWQLDRKTGSPVDVADPNIKTVKQLHALKSWSQGAKVAAPHVKLNSTGTKLNSAGNKLQAAPIPKGSDFYFNAAENQMELKSDPSPHRPTPQAKKVDPAAGAKYIDWWDR